MKGSVIGWVCLSWLSLAAAADTGQERQCRDVSFPEHVQVSGSGLALNGLGVRKATFLKINVYVAALYVAKPQRDPAALVDSDTPQELVLHFVRNVDAAELRKAFLEAFARNRKRAVRLHAGADCQAQQLDERCQNRPTADVRPAAPCGTAGVRERSASRDDRGG